MKELRKKYPGSQYSEYKESSISLLWLAYVLFVEPDETEPDNEKRKQAETPKTQLECNGRGKNRGKI